MGFGDKVHSCKFELCHLPNYEVLSPSILIFKMDIMILPISNVYFEN